MENQLQSSQDDTLTVVVYNEKGNGISTEKDSTLQKVQKIPFS